MEKDRYDIYVMEVDEEDHIIPGTDKWQASFFDGGDARNYFLNMVDSVRNSKKEGIRTRVAMEYIGNYGVTDVDDEIIA